MLKLTDEDKTYIKLTESGIKPSPAFREAYPEHDAVIFYRQTDPGTPQRQKAAEVLKQAAKFKLQTKYIKSALMTYQDRMEEYSSLSLETAIDLVQHARSEKVRADLAIEGVRHKIGSPVTKIAIKEDKVVYLTFSKPPSEIIEGETVDVLGTTEEQDDQDGFDDN